jgi:tetratricopeptide (TPR) repeat protein
MQRCLVRGLLSTVFLSVLLHAQLDRISFPAGSPEDQALQTISKEPDDQKKLPLYEDFLQKFSASPAAVAYGNWQLSQYYQTAGDLPKALEYGDKALAGSPHNLDILVSQANMAQQMKDNGKLIDYAVRGGVTYNSIAKATKPEGMSDQEFATQVEEQKNSAKSSYEFLEAAAYNSIAGEADAKKRMSYIERFTPAFPSSRFEEQVTSYAMVSLSELKDTSRLIAFGEKTLATNPNSLPALLLLSGTYVDDPRPGSAAKADAPDSDKARKVPAGVAHSALGYAYMNQEKTAAAVPELKAASGLLKGQDDQQYAIALYRLGYAYGKLNKFTEAREVLNEAVKIPGPVQPLAQDLLTKVNAARAKGR